MRPTVNRVGDSSTGVIWMTSEFELRLIDAAAPNGEIAAKDLSGLASALQELTLRIGRDIVQTPGPGRTKQYVEEFSQLRLCGLTAGSTVLQFTKGPINTLDVAIPEQELADERFWEVLAGISDNRRADWVSELVAESASKLINALRVAAPRAELSSASRPTIGINVAGLQSEIWSPPGDRLGGLTQIHGRLEKVDLRSHEFRVRDDVDQAVELRHVENDSVAGQLVGQWVVAEGESVLHQSGRLVALDNVRVHGADDPAAAHLGRHVVPLSEILLSAPGADFDGGIELTSTEFDEFLRAARS